MGMNRSNLEDKEQTFSPDLMSSCHEQAHRVNNDVALGVWSFGL